MRRIFVPREPSPRERFASLAVAVGVAVVGAGVAYYLVRTLAARDEVTSGDPRLLGQGPRSSRTLAAGEGSERG